MYFLLKLTVVILILYLKLNGLNTTTLIDRYKSTIHSHSDSSSSNTKANIASYDNNNNNYGYGDNTTSSVSWPINRIDNGSAKSNEDSYNNQYNDHSSLSTDVATTVATTRASHNKEKSVNFSSINLAAIGNSEERKWKAIADKSNYYYNVVKGNYINQQLPTIDEAELKPNPITTENVFDGTSTIITASEPTTTSTTTDAPGYDLTTNNGLNSALSKGDVDLYLLKNENNNENTCLLDDIKTFFTWWTFPNGTLNAADLQYSPTETYLDLSFRNISKDNILYTRVIRSFYLNGKPKIIAFSAANNNLTHAPYKTLMLMNSTLKYLTLKGNQFAAITTEQQKDVISHLLNDTNIHPEDIDSEEFNINLNNEKLFNKKDAGIAWATFPLLHNLVELDISNCRIESVTKDVFQNMTSLRRLNISRNKMLAIPNDAFNHVPLLNYLDISFTNVLDFDYQIPLPTLEVVLNLIYGLKIHQNAFKGLKELMYLDLSHSKLTRNSAVAFAHLGEKLRFLSLCYTAFPLVGNALFKNTALVGLDLSGNPYAAYNIIDDALDGVSDTLRYLYFERSNLKNMTWMKNLKNLRVLGVAGNNINAVSLETFSPLRGLRVLDLSSNHVGNWYSRAFTNNQELRVLNLRDNNINWINLEMLKDFQPLEYLSLGDNNFVCDCLLRDLVDIAAENNKEAECSQKVLKDAQEVLVGHLELASSHISPDLKQKMVAGYEQFQSALYSSSVDDLSGILTRKFVPRLQQSYKNMEMYNKARNHKKMRFLTRFYQTYRDDDSSKCPPSETVPVSDKLNGSTLKFQLLDYEDEHYWCFNETERLHFVQLNCEPRSFTENIAEKLHTLTKYVVGSVCTVLGLSLLGILIYLKRWHILYYYSSLKTAALMSVATKESIATQDPNMAYDIFISYCQNDRQWVLDELLPNVEDTDNISICLHERDFQIGLTILDNIVNCMDRSRALMLIISSNFLLSHWCQFEMHLAQHRIFEVSKEHLIIVFLEDIPRSKRPKTLQYLMEIKTYIKWPAAKGNKPVKPEERKLFWKRLKRTLQNIGLDNTESNA